MSISSPDINECELDIDNCDQQATCTNTEGSYSCSCNTGWTGDGFTCEGIKNEFGLIMFSVIEQHKPFKDMSIFPRYQRMRT